jgi:hypothetical protein
MSFCLTRLGRNRRPRKLLIRAGAILSAMLCTVFLAGSPAMAAGSPNLLQPLATGDTGWCIISATIQGYNGTFCIRLGIFASGSQDYITAQATGICENTAGQSVSCSNIVITATIANGAGYTGWRTIACGHTNGNCLAGGTNFYTYGQLPISPGTCDNNVWAVINGNDRDTYITLPGSDKNVYLDGFNLEDGHFSKVCVATDNSFFVVK